jgi:hypothetical protein
MVEPLRGVPIAWMVEMTLLLRGLVVVVVAGETESLHAASISVMATVATTLTLRIVHSYSTSALRRDVGMITRSGRYSRSGSDRHRSISALITSGGTDRIGTTLGSQMPMNRVPRVFRRALTRHVPALPIHRHLVE